jgi:Flp pilus assembly CpaF family ATPase
MGDPGKTSTREEQTRRLVESMKRQLGSFCGLLRESDVVELMLNADGTVWVDRLGQPMQPAGSPQRRNPSSRPLPARSAAP